MSQFLINIKYFTDKEVLGRLQTAVEKHMSDAQELKEANILVTGGPILNESGAMCGSFIVANHESKDALIELLSKDVFATSKVWDLSTLKIERVQVVLG